MSEFSRHLSTLDNTEEKYDVAAVSIGDSRILWIDGPKTEADAEAIIGMAIMRQGLDDRFFAKVPTGKFKQGEKYSSEGK